MASWSPRAGTEAEAGGINPSNTKQYQFAGVKNYCFTWLNCQNFCHISSETFRWCIGQQKLVLESRLRFQLWYYMPNGFNHRVRLQCASWAKINYIIKHKTLKRPFIHEHICTVNWPLNYFWQVLTKSSSIDRIGMPCWRLKMKVFGIVSNVDDFLNLSVNFLHFQDHKLNICTFLEILGEEE